MKKVKVVIVVFIVCVILGAIASIGDKEEVSNTNIPVQSKVEEKAKEGVVEVAKEKSTTKEIEYLEVTATEMIANYENEAKGNKLYEDKYIELTGKISSISEVLDNYYIHVDSGADFELMSVSCKMNEDQLDAITELNEDDNITIRGLCEGKSFMIDMEGCEIVK